jgi:hypothetical protein
MPAKTSPVSDSVPKINDEVAVGEDLKFQSKWWHFEGATWICFGALLVMDLLGVFGRGPVAKAHAEAADHSMDINYERIERFSTPSILSVRLGENAIQNGKAMLWVSQSLVKKMGNERVVPQPLESRIGNGGILYTFAATGLPAQVEFALVPASPGIGEIKFQIPGHSAVNLRIYIVP